MARKKVSPNKNQQYGDDQPNDNDASNEGDTGKFNNNGASNEAATGEPHNNGAFNKAATDKTNDNGASNEAATGTSIDPSNGGGNDDISISGSDSVLSQEIHFSASDHDSADDKGLPQKYEKKATEGRMRKHTRWARRQIERTFAKERAKAGSGPRPPHLSDEEQLRVSKQIAKFHCGRLVDYKTLSAQMRKEQNMPDPKIDSKPAATARKANASQTKRTSPDKAEEDDDSVTLVRVKPCKLPKFDYCQQPSRFFPRQGEFPNMFFSHYQVGLCFPASDMLCSALHVLGRTKLANRIKYVLQTLHPCENWMNPVNNAIDHELKQLGMTIVTIPYDFDVLENYYHLPIMVVLSPKNVSGFSILGSLVFFPNSPFAQTFDKEVVGKLISHHMDAKVYYVKYDEQSKAKQLSKPAEKIPQKHSGHHNPGNYYGPPGSH